MILSSEIKLFLIFCLSGTTIGVFFDLFRIIRRSFKISDIHTYIEDIIFGIITGIYLIFIIFIYNDGNIRLYMFIGFFLGLIIYLLTISKYFVKINVIIVTTIKKIIIKVLGYILYPFKQLIRILRKLLNKQFMLLIINIKKLSNIFMLKKVRKSKKILKERKDFTN